MEVCILAHEYVLWLLNTVDIGRLSTVIIQSGTKYEDMKTKTKVIDNFIATCKN